MGYKASKSEIMTLRGQPGTAKRLADADEPFTASDVGIGPGEQTRLRLRNVIQPAGTNEEGTAVYRLTDPAREYVDGASFDHVLPCLHDGVRFLGDGEVTCQNDDCDRTYDAEAHPEVLP